MLLRNTNVFVIVDSWIYLNLLPAHGYLRYGSSRCSYLFEQDSQKNTNFELSMKCPELNNDDLYTFHEVSPRSTYYIAQNIAWP